MTAIDELYAPLIVRDLEAIPRAVKAFRETNSSEDLFEAVSRFATLAVSPSQHGKHSFLASVAAGELRAAMGDRWDGLLAECAIYAAESRLPWSEPPVGDPPKVSPDHPAGLEEIRSAIASGDRLRAERWLAARMNEPAFANDFFAVASEDLSDLGHKLIVAVAAWKVALQQDGPYRFPLLRVAVNEWTAHLDAPVPLSDDPVPSHDIELIARSALEACVREGGDAISFHQIAMLDAGLEAASFAPESHALSRVVHAIHKETNEAPLAAPPVTITELELPVYRLSRDYGEYLKSFAIAGRMKKRFPSMDWNQLCAAAKRNLDSGLSFEEWSFA